MYAILRAVGIKRFLSFIVVFSVAFTERFFWASHVIRPEIYVCVFLSLALLLMIRKPLQSRSLFLNDLVIGVVCGLCVWVYDTGLIVVFAFGAIYLFKWIVTMPGGWDGKRFLRCISYTAGAILFVSLWYFLNRISNPEFLSDTASNLGKYEKFYLKGVPPSLHFLARFGGLFYIPRSLIGYFLSPAWRPHLLELIILIPTVHLTYKRIKNRELSAPDRDCLLLIAFMLLGFIIAGYMTFYFLRL
jgi:hypothetical protein